LLEEYSDEKYIIFQMSRLDSIAYIIQHDPFWLMRAKINIAREVDNSIPLLHRKFIKKDFFPSGKIESALGFNCFIEDSDIEGSAAYQTRLEESKRFLDELFLYIPHAPFADDIDESNKQEVSE
jgi:hypothetical protein